MKSLVTLFTICCVSFYNSQVIIGDAVGTATDKTSVLLEFANSNNKGIILPYAREKSAAAYPGAILLDASNGMAARIKYYNGKNLNVDDGWVDLSGVNANVSDALSQQPVEVVEDANAKVIIGNTNSSANGVLVLESTDKAMVLPAVTDVKDIKSPAPGMMVYVNKAGAKRLAVFNGTYWSFWRSE